MVVRVLGSSSKGNCYLFVASNEVLVAECGLPLSEVKKSLQWQINGIVGAIVSHAHNDHAKYIGEFMKNGVKVMALPDVFSAKNLSGHPFARPLTPMKGVKVGGFKVLPLPVAHDVPCLAFVIEHAEMGRTLFVTDTMLLKWRVPHLNHIMIEANYSDALLDEAILDGTTDKAMRARLLNSHMELGTTIKTLKANDLTGTSEIILLHLSHAHADGDEFCKKVISKAGKPCYVATAGLEVELNINPY